jgi:hypothetical protein
VSREWQFLMRNLPTVIALLTLPFSITSAQSINSQLLGSSSETIIAGDDLTSAEASFRYINSTLQTFSTTGRLVKNPGVDGADLEAYLEYLQFFYDEFSGGFNRNSAMCRFYMDPENSRMTLEEKAELSFSFLRSLEDRVARYIAIDREFQITIEDQFGSILLRNINEAKGDALSNQRLPSTSFDEAAVINFIDSVCA